VLYWHDSVRSYVVAPAALSPELRRLRALVLTPLGPSSIRLVNEPELPASKLPEPNATDAVAQGLRLTVLVPAHDEALTAYPITQPSNRHLAIGNRKSASALPSHQHAAPGNATAE